MVRRVVVAVLATCVGLMGASVTAQAATATSVSGWVTTATSGAVGYTIKDAVSVKTGTGYMARSVSVQRRPSTSSTWSTVTTGTTSAAGAYTAAYTVPSTGVWYFRLSVKATSTAASATTASRKVTGITGATTAVSGWVNTSTSGAVGYTIKDAVSVKTGTGYVARSVSVQRRPSTSSTWSTVTTGTTSAAGAYTAAYTVPSTGVWYFRLRVSPTATAAATTTSSRKVTGITGATTAVSGWVTTPISGAVASTIRDAVSVKTGTGYVTRSVNVQRRPSTSSTWSTVSTGTTSAAGAYTAAYTVPSAGVWFFRLSVSPTATAAAATTTARQVTGVLAPTVTAISPASGPIAGGTVVTVTGTNLMGATAVTFGTTAGTNVSITSATQLSATSPSTAVAGSVPVTVTTPGGTSATSASSTFGYTGPAPDTTPPGPVTSVTSSVTASTVDLSWVNPTDADFTGVTIRRASGATPPTSPTDGTSVTDTDQAATSFTDTGLAAGTQYSYALFAHDAVPNHAPGATSTASTAPAPDTTAPAPVTGITSSVTASAVTLSWVNPTDADFTGVTIRRASGATPPTSPTDGTSVTDTDQAATSFTDTGLVAGTQYSYALFAHDAVPNHSTAATATVSTPAPADTTPPGPVTALEVTATTSSSVALSWTNPGDADVARVLVRRATGSTPPSLTTGQQVASSAAPSTTLVDSGLDPATEYAYALFAQDASGNTSEAATVTVTTEAAPQGWVMLSAGASHLCGLRPDGTAWCSGSNDAGQLGTGGSEVHSLEFVRVTGDGAWTSIDAGASHTCGVKADGSAWCWGGNRWAELGNGTTSTDPHPVPLRVGTSTDWASVDAGREYTCGLKKDGTAWCWGGAGGNTGMGMLGDGSGEQLLVPTRVAGAAGWAEVRAGWFHTCGRKTDGTAWCWGYNNMGQIGNGTSEWQLVPAAVAGSASWRALTVGAYHTCGIRIDGLAWCWGYNYGHQVGDGTQEDRSTPVAVSGAASWISLAGGYFHTCGVRGDGTLWCWGDNSLGQLAAHGVPWSAVPAQVGDVSTWASVVSGYDSNLALRGDASAWRWGATFWRTDPAVLDDPERF